MYIKDMEEHFARAPVRRGRKRKNLPSRRGIFDFEECLRRLKDAGFNGAALIEVYAGDYGEYRELKGACDYLDEIIYKIG